MRVNLLSIIMLFLFNYYMNAQDSKIELGIKSGILLSKYSPDQFINNLKTTDYRNRIGYNIGGFLNFKFSEKIRLQPEIIFSKQGTNLREEILIEFPPFSGEFISAGGNIEFEINESIIVLPITIQYFILKRLNLEGGFQLGYILNRELELTKKPDNVTITGDLNSLSNDKFDFGLNFGLGYNILESLRINTRYVFGIVERDDVVKPTVFSFGLEYKL